MNNLGSSRRLGSNSTIVVGRVASRSGQIVDLVFGGSADLNITDAFEIQRLIQQPSELAKDFLERAEHPHAFVGIGFGPAPISDFDKLLWKGKFVEAEHPRVPGGTSDGGEFAAANEASGAGTANDAADNIINQDTVLKDLMSRVKRRAARAILRNRLINVLRAIGGLGADVVPYAGEVFDAYELAQAITNGIALEKDIAAATAFVEGGPKTLESLLMGPEDQSFSSFDAFKKDEFGKYYGGAGNGLEYHHIVEQGATSGSRIPTGLLQSTGNIVRIPRLLHEEISAEYGETYKDTGKTLRDWLSTQPYEVRRAEGIRVMRDLGIIK